MKQLEIQNLGQLRISGYQSRSIKEELRENLIARLRLRESAFEGIVGFENTVIPDLERAILSRHNILLLGLRGQAKTRLARLMVNLLDEYIPVVEGSELNDDPLAPLSRYAKDKIAEMGNLTPITWLHREERYVEKLATPDVSIADLIGDIDPIKAASLKLHYSDERVIHFGLLARAHRSIFVINELPDLQARIQVALFNILQEGDIQIRGFKLRLPLDVQFVFTANPEDYTNRGSIITPLKDRIGSQILTHYPLTLEHARRITQQEAKIPEAQRSVVAVSELAKDLIERIAIEARSSDLVDEKSGVSARLTISGYENLMSSAERRMLINGENQATVRLTDFWGVLAAVTGKVELVYEGEQSGAAGVAMELLKAALKKQFLELFPNPEKLKKKSDSDPYGTILAWFSDGNTVDLLLDASEVHYRQQLEKVAGLEKFVLEHNVNKNDKYIYMELVLNALAETQQIQRQALQAGIQFQDPLADALDDLDFDFEED